MSSGPNTPTPPTTRGPMPPPAPPPPHRVLRGMLIHVCCVFPICFIVPLAMGSNLWPIAGVIWSVLTVPVAAATGAIIALVLKKLPLSQATLVAVFTGVALAIATGIIVYHNK